MIKENEIVTKKYLTKELSTFRKELKTEIMTEVRILMHEITHGAMENMKVFYLEENKRHISALIQGVREEVQVFKDAMLMMNQKLDNHENRLQVLES